MNLSSHRKHINIANKNLSYIDIGTGPVLLLGHSYLWDAHMWAPQLAHLSQHYRCIAPDLWGHGESDSLPESSHSLQDIADHMLELMNALSIDTFSVIGLSVGGMWGAELVLKAPSRVNSLVMLSSFIGFEPEVARDKYYAMMDIIKQAQAVPATLIEQIAPLCFAKDAATNTPELVNNFKASLAAIQPDRIESLYRLGKMIFGRRDTLEEVEQFNLPCLIMNGAEDTVRPILEGYLMHDAIHNSQFVHIPHAGHIATLEQADFINQHLSVFLNH